MPFSLISDARELEAGFVDDEVAGFGGLVAERRPVDVQELAVPLHHPTADQDCVDVAPASSSVANGPGSKVEKSRTNRPSSGRITLFLFA
jgi:hypothetical protein